MVADPGASGRWLPRDFVLERVRGLEGLVGFGEGGALGLLRLGRVVALAWPESAPPPAPHHRAKYTPARVAELKSLLAAGMLLATAARLLGIPRTTAQQMADNRTWKKVPPALPA
jgi:hypothetical protein